MSYADILPKIYEAMIKVAKRRDNRTATIIERGSMQHAIRELVNGRGAKDDEIYKEWQFDEMEMFNELAGMDGIYLTDEYGEPYTPGSIKYKTGEATKIFIKTEQHQIPMMLVWSDIIGPPPASG